MDIKGLTTKQAEDKLKEAGANILPHEKPYSKIRLFFNQFNSPLMYILLGTVLVAVLLKHYTDSFFIIFVLLINTTVGFWQENKANNSLLALKKMVKIRAKVIRDGFEREIDSELLVLGDIVLLRAGDKIPADGKILECKNFRVNEASLTGEWMPVEKNAEDKAFMGTIAEEGSATIEITATGLNTQIGGIVTLLKETKERKTPLQKKIAYLSKLLGAFILAVILIIAVTEYLRGTSFSDIWLWQYLLYQKACFPL